MKTKEFKYESKDGLVSEKKIYPLNETENAVVGIDLKLLSETEVEELKTVVETYEAGLKPFVSKAFRRYLVAKITES